MARNKADISYIPDEASLAEELGRLRDLICSRAGSCPQTDSGEQDCANDGLTLARLCPGLSLEDWERLRSAGDFRQWIAVPLEGEILPAVKSLQRALEEMAYETSHDPLTGLGNRRVFDRMLALELERSRREGTKLVVAMLDLDNFKAINDTHGHACGDEVLVALGRCLQENKRAYDFAARFGGEEFVLVLPGTGLYEAQAMLERLLEDFSGRSFHCADAQFRVTFSGGIAMTRGGDISSEQFLELADKALYKAKSLGKQRIQAARPHEESLRERAAMVHSDEKRFLFSGNG